MRFTIPEAPATSPHRPAVRAGVQRGHNCYSVPGVATVEAWPHRGLSSARAIARRICKHPDQYLSVIQTYSMPGVTDERRRRVRAA